MSPIPACAGEVSSRPQEAANTATTYRVVLEPETRPREAPVALDHLPVIRVDAPNVDVAAPLAVPHHIDSRAAQPPAGTPFGLVVITPATHDPKVSHRDPGDEVEMCHVNVACWPTATAVR